MSFRYYIVSLFDGSVKGTDDIALAEDYGQSEDDFVIDTQTNEWIHPAGKRIQIVAHEEDYPNE